MPYTAVTLQAMVTELSSRLYDPNNVFWTVAELVQGIQDALRFWNVMTAQNVAWYSLPVSAGPWYDLQTLTGSPRFCTLTDQDVYSRLQYKLLEQQLPNAGVSSSQFSTQLFLQSVEGKRDELIFRTNCTRTVTDLPTEPNVATIVLPEAVIAVERGYWLPAQGMANPIYRSDQFAKTAYYGLASSSIAQTPITFSTGLEPPLGMELYPAPGAPGQVEAITIDSQGILNSETATLLEIPGDFVPGLAWGALADLLDGNAEARDAERAQYARMRFEHYCEASSIYPLILGARVNNIDTFVGSVESLDIYNPLWRTPTANQQTVAWAGQNLICYPSTTTQDIALLINGNAQIPLTLAAPVQLGREVIDAVLDLAQHEAMFKQGSAEISQSMGLYKNFLAVASKKNDRVRANSVFRDFLYGENSNQELFAPLGLTNA